MTTWFARDASGLWPAPSEGLDRRISPWALLAGLVVAVGVLTATAAAAQEPKVAPAEGAEPEAAATDPPAEPEPVEESATPPSSGIEEIVVTGAESEATADFEAADSVTGFGAEDLAALGAQDIADLAAFTPNLEIVTSGATTPTFFIRGVGLNDFNPNSTGAVAIYQDDVPRNAPALQLSTLFDVEAVNILRGPQGVGQGRNASAGAIKIYSRKPTGEYSAFLRSDFGDYNFRDFEGAIEVPIYEDLLAGRFAFRYAERDGTMENRCGDAEKLENREARPSVQTPSQPLDPDWSICNEPVLPGFPSDIPAGLADEVNDLSNWAARGTLLVQPTLDMTWLLNAHGSRRKERSRLGQSYGMRGFFCKDGDIDNCFGFGAEFDPDDPACQDDDPLTPCGSRINGQLGGHQSGPEGGYQAPEVVKRLTELAPCFGELDARGNNTCSSFENRASADAAKQKVAKELAKELDSKPWKGDFNRTGPTINDTWGTYVNGEIVLPTGMVLNSITGYDTYDRTIDLDLDFSPQTRFQILTEDDGWQVVQTLSLGAQLDDRAIRWEVGGWFLREQLNVNVFADLGEAPDPSRDYEQNLYSAAGYATLSFGFWNGFTLDGGFRYNWERKEMDYQLFIAGETDRCVFSEDCSQTLEDTWSAPTGTIRLTYNFREDTHAFWKYTRGWKPGTYNATGSRVTGSTAAREETIDAFETGLRGSWFDGRLGLDASIFYYSYTDYQIFTAQQFIGTNPEFVILNANDAEVYGSEIDLVGRPWLGAFMNVRFAWLESQFLDFVQIQQELAPGGRVINRELQNSGNPLLNSPKFKVSLTAEQMIPMGRWGSITARYDGVWTDTTYYDATAGRGIPNTENINFQPEDTIGQVPFWLHNLRLSYRPPGGRFEIAGWVRNLTNEAYKTFAFDASTFDDTSIYFVGDPRTIGGSISLSF